MISDRNKPTLHWQESPLLDGIIYSVVIPSAFIIKTRYPRLQIWWWLTKLIFSKVKTND